VHAERDSTVGVSEKSEMTAIGAAFPARVKSSLDPVQNANCQDQRFDPFFQHCARLR
jgi:hypothetical protein